MTGPPDTLLWSGLRRRNYAGRRGAPRRATSLAARTPLSLRPGDWRSRPRSRDRPDGHERGPSGETERSAAGSRRLLRDVQEAFDDAGGALPLRFFLVELLAPGGRQRVDLHATAALRGAPLRRNPAHLLQLEQRRIQGALVERELIAADLLDSP